MTSTTTATPVAPREADLESFFRHHVRALGVMILKLAPIHAGTPDRLVILPGGSLYLVELKTSRGELRPIQVAFHESARRLGVTVIVLRGKGECLAWLRDHLDAAAGHRDTPRALAK